MLSILNLLTSQKVPQINNAIFDRAIDNVVDLILSACPYTMYQYMPTLKYFYIGPVKQILFVYNCDYFLIHQFKRMFWVIKRTISSRQFF